MSDDLHCTPGSDAARERGCTCPVTDNCHGRGYRSVQGCYVIHADCSLHGPDAIRAQGAEAMRKAAIGAVLRTAAPVQGTIYSVGGRVFAQAVEALSIFPVPGWRDSHPAQTQIKSMNPTDVSKAHQVDALFAKIGKEDSHA